MSPPKLQRRRTGGTSLRSSSLGWLTTVSQSNEIRAKLPAVALAKAGVSSYGGLF